MVKFSRAAACKHGLEGIVSKRLDRPYLPGDRGAWVKTKCLNRAEFVIVGWSDPEGSRPYVGALLLGTFERDGRLVYAGRVGTGMSQKTLATLHKRLQPLAIKKMPLVVPPPRDNRFGRPLELAKAHWVRPELVAEITYLSWPEEGLLRHTVLHWTARGQAGERGSVASARGPDGEDRRPGDGMGEEDAGSRLRVLVKAVSDDLWIAIATFEVYAPSAFDAALIAKSTRGRSIPPSTSYPKRWKQRRSPRFAASGTRQATQPASPRSRNCCADRRRQRRASAMARRCRDGREVRRASSAPRDWNMRLAHTHDPNRLDFRLPSGVRNAAIEDERLLLEATILVIQQLRGLIGSPDSLDYRAEREAWRARAESFWKSVGGALV